MNRPQKFTPTFSPFEVTFTDHDGNIPTSFIDQFLLTPDSPYTVVMNGHLDVWFRPKWLAPLFKLLELFGILISEPGENIPVSLTVEAKYDANHRSVHYWNRTFHYSKLRYFNTVLPFDAKFQDVGDFVGKGHLVYIVWDTNLSPPNLYTMHTRACAIHLYGHFIWLPAWLWQHLFGILDFKQITDNLESNKSYIELTIQHPWLGDFFGYKGKFEISRVYKDET